MPLNDVTRTSVLQAIEECDEFGRTQFLEQYGFGSGRTTWFIHRGNCYDSKAIVGAAHGYACPDLGPLTWNDSYGGDPVRNILSNLNFTATTNRENASFSKLQVVSPDTADDESFDPTNVLDARKRIRTSIAQRRGQRSFRDALIVAYNGRAPLQGLQLFKS